MDIVIDVQETLIKAVVKRLMSDAPLAMLLSGGLDSSLIASIACRYAHQSSLQSSLPCLHTRLWPVPRQSHCIAFSVIGHLFKADRIHVLFAMTVERGASMRGWERRAGCSVNHLMSHRPQLHSQSLIQLALQRTYKRALTSA